MIFLQHPLLIPTNIQIIWWNKYIIKYNYPNKNQLKNWFKNRSNVFDDSNYRSRSNIKEKKKKKTNQLTIYRGLLQRHSYLIPTYDQIITLDDPWLRSQYKVKCPKYVSKMNKGCISDAFSTTDLIHTCTTPQGVTDYPGDDDLDWSEQTSQSFMWLI